MVFLCTSFMWLNFSGTAVSSTGTRLKRIVVLGCFVFLDLRAVFFLSGDMCLLFKVNSNKFYIEEKIIVLA